MISQDLWILTNVPDESKSLKSLRGAVISLKEKKGTTSVIISPTPGHPYSNTLYASTSKHQCKEAFNEIVELLKTKGYLVDLS